MLRYFAATTDETKASQRKGFHHRMPRPKQAAEFHLSVEFLTSTAHSDLDKALRSQGFQPLEASINRHVYEDGDLNTFDLTVRKWAAVQTEMPLFRIQRLTSESLFEYS